MRYQVAKTDHQNGTAHEEALPGSKTPPEGGRKRRSWSTQRTGGKFEKKGTSEMRRLVLANKEAVQLTLSSMERGAKWANLTMSRKNCMGALRLAEKDRFRETPVEKETPRGVILGERPRKIA